MCEYGGDDGEARSAGFDPPERKLDDTYKKGGMTKSIVLPSFQPGMLPMGYPPSEVEHGQWTLSQLRIHFRTSLRIRRPEDGESRPNHERAGRRSPGAWERRIQNTLPTKTSATDQLEASLDQRGFPPTVTLRSANPPWQAENINQMFDHESFVGCSQGAAGREGSLLPHRSDGSPGGTVIVSGSFFFLSLARFHAVKSRPRELSGRFYRPIHSRSFIGALQYTSISQRPETLGLPTDVANLLVSSTRRFNLNPSPPRILKCSSDASCIVPGVLPSRRRIQSVGRRSRGDSLVTACIMTRPTCGAWRM